MKTVDELMDLDYRISLHKEDGDYIATVDDLPGCVADGRTPNKAVESVREAMKSWMTSRLEAGLDVPEPRDTSAFSGKLVVRMPKSLHKKLSGQAASEGVSLNQHIVSTLSEAWGKSCAAEDHGSALAAIYTNMTRTAARWANATVVPQAPAGQTFLQNYWPNLNPGFATHIRDAVMVGQDASTGFWYSADDDQQPRPRRGLAA